MAGYCNSSYYLLKVCHRAEGGAVKASTKCRYDDSSILVMCAYANFSLVVPHDDIALDIVLEHEDS